MPPKKATAVQKGKSVAEGTSQTRRVTRVRAQSMPGIMLQSESSATPPPPEELRAVAAPVRAPVVSVDQVWRISGLETGMARTRGGAFGGDAPGASAWGRRRPRGRGRAAAPAWDMEKEPHAAHVPQPVGPGPAQPPPAPVAAPDLHSLLTQILAAIGNMRQAPAPAVPAPALQDQPPPVHVAASPDLEVREMPLRDQKMLGVFQRLAPPIFSGAIGEDAHEFQLTCQEQLQSLGLLESRGADFTAH
nr:uncharacterized protein LOC112940523 [Solanum lycopersicum]